MANNNIVSCNNYVHLISLREFTPTDTTEWKLHYFHLLQCYYLTRFVNIFIFKVKPVHIRRDHFDLTQP